MYKATAKTSKESCLNLFGENIFKKKKKEVKEIYWCVWKTNTYLLLILIVPKLLVADCRESTSRRSLFVLVLVLFAAAILSGDLQLTDSLLSDVRSVCILDKSFSVLFIVKISNLFLLSHASSISSVTLHGANSVTTVSFGTSLSIDRFI